MKDRGTRATRAKPLPSIALLRRMLDYNEATGALRWRIKPQQRIAPGELAGGIGPDGYLSLRVKGHTLKGHRVAFAIKTGRWPRCHIDHCNGRKADNRWANLREANSSQNAHNRAGANANNKSTGCLGVHRRADGLGFTARIAMHLGTFKHFHAAKAARIRAERLLHGEFAAHARPTKGKKA